MGVSRRDELCRRGDDERIGALQRGHCRGDGLLDAPAAQPLPHDDIGDDLAVCGRMENGTLLLKRGAKFKRVGQIPVMGQGHAPLAVVDEQGLGVGSAV